MILTVRRLTMKPLKLKYNRVWRTYTGGKAIDEFYGKATSIDTYYPEVWIASTVAAINPDFVEGEGLSIIEGSDQPLLELIESDPNTYLGETHVKNFGPTAGILTKLLDAGERLTIQVHPNKEKAMSLFQSEYGKTEAWYIMDGREIDGEAPHIYLGFKEGIDPETWANYFKEQNIQGMLDSLHKIYVNPGDVYLIEGGTPHAIGAGCFILEIQEPTDLTIRIEKITPGGYEIPDRICHQGLGFEKMFECFDFNGHTEQEVIDKWQISNKKDLVGSSQTLISYDHTKCFSLERYVVSEPLKLASSEAFSVFIVLEGSGILTLETASMNVQKGDQIFVPASCSDLVITTDEGCEPLNFLRCLPPTK